MGPTDIFEVEARRCGYRYIAGLDEAGRGPLAGPVVAAAVIFPRRCRVRGLNDSKQLSAAERDQLFVYQGPGCHGRCRFRDREGDRPDQHSGSNPAGHATSDRIIAARPGLSSLGCADPAAPLNPSTSDHHRRLSVLLHCCRVRRSQGHAGSDDGRLSSLNIPSIIFSITRDIPPGTSASPRGVTVRAPFIDARFGRCCFA